MSISRARRERASARRTPTPAIEVKTVRLRLPATASRRALLKGGSDERFRRLVYDLLTIASRMTVVRERLASRMGISAPQYSLLMAVGQFQGERGVGVTAVAKVLHVSSAFVATETGKLAQAGLLTKRANPKDRRAVLLSLNSRGTRFDRAKQRRNLRGQRPVFRRADADGVYCGFGGHGSARA